MKFVFKLTPIEKYFIKRRWQMDIFFNRWQNTQTRYVFQPLNTPKPIMRIIDTRTGEVEYMYIVKEGGYGFIPTHQL